MAAKSVSGITLYRGFPTVNAYPWSPFAAKLEAWLRFSQLQYNLEQGSPRSGPRTKIPYVDISYQGQEAPTTMGDTVLISKQLVADGACADLNGQLAPDVKARGAAIQSLLEDKLYWYHVSCINSALLYSPLCY